LCTPPPSPLPRPSSLRDCCSKVPKATCFSEEKADTMSAITARLASSAVPPRGGGGGVPGQRALSRGRPQRPRGQTEVLSRASLRALLKDLSPAAPGFFLHPARHPPRYSADRRRPTPPRPPSRANGAGTGNLLHPSSGRHGTCSAAPAPSSALERGAVLPPA
jgi:hypothetical protein